jgi:MFS family permease
MYSLVIPIQPELPVLLNASKADTSWVVTVALLSAAVFTPIAGRLGDLFGKRRVMLGLLAVLIVGSLVSAFSNSLEPLIVGRALQGAAVGLIPLGVSILRDVLPPERLGGAIALVSATLGIGAAVGLPVSAIVIDAFEWHAIFWVAALLGVVLSILIIAIVPPSTLRSEGTFDLPGAVGLAVGLSGVLLAVSKGNEWGWTSAATLGCGVGGLAVLLLWGVFELRRPSPLVDLRVASRGAVLMTNLASVAMGFTFFATYIALPQLLVLPASTGVGLGQTLLVASLVLTPSGLVMMIMAPVAARLGRRYGPRALLFIGALMMVLSYVVALIAHTEIWHILLVSILIGFGIGLGYAAMPTLIMRAVPVAETAAANGLNSLMRTLGTVIAAAVVGAILASSSAQFSDALIPTADGFQFAFATGLVASIVAATLALLIPRSEHYPERTALPSSGDR